jgi:catechol 2,3-dioxygenase-like lactoylglutathione lyase family enzyme
LSARLIAGFDHIVIAVRDLAKGVAAYELLLGRRAIMGDKTEGVAAALIVTENIAVEIMAPTGESETALRLGATIDEGGEGLKSLVFATSDIDRAHRRIERVGLDPEPIVARESSGDAWRSFRANTQRTNGMRLFFMQRDAPMLCGAAGEAGVVGLDHVVIRSGAPDRVAALYGARLGLDMRLDREIAGRRLMFFRCGDAVVEVVLDDAMTGGRDALWGLSWRVSDAVATRARLLSAGLDVSEVRPGLKPGTRVFTVRDGSCGVPTLMVEPGPKRD